MFWYRDGKYVVIYGAVTAGTVTSANGYFNLPTGLTPDTSLIGDDEAHRYGTAERLDNGATTDPKDLSLFYNSSDATNIYITDRAASNTYTVIGADTSVGSNNTIVIEARVPISGWNG
jgi:hypothetical protein